MLDIISLILYIDDTISIILYTDDQNTKQTTNIMQCVFDALPNSVPAAETPATGGLPASLQKCDVPFHHRLTDSVYFYAVAKSLFRIMQLYIV